MPHLLTPETARLAGIKSGESRRANPVRHYPRPQIVQLTQQTPAPYQFEHAQERLKVLHQQIRRTHERLSEPPRCYCDKCEQPIEMPDHHRAQLLKALASLLEQERVLRGIPAPAPFKAERPRTRRESYDIQPIDVAPKPKAYDGPETG